MLLPGIIMTTSSTSKSCASRRARCLVCLFSLLFVLFLIFLFFHFSCSCDRGTATGGWSGSPRRLWCRQLNLSWTRFSPPTSSVLSYSDVTSVSEVSCCPPCSLVTGRWAGQWFLAFGTMRCLQVGGLWLCLLPLIGWRFEYRCWSGPASVVCVRP